MLLKSDTEDIVITHQKTSIAVKPNEMHRLNKTATHKCVRVAELGRDGLLVNTSRVKKHLRLNAALKRTTHNTVWRKSIQAFTQ